MGFISSYFTIGFSLEGEQAVPDTLVTAVVVRESVQQGLKVGQMSILLILKVLVSAIVQALFIEDS